GHIHPRGYPVEEQVDRGHAVVETRDRVPGVIHPVGAGLAVGAEHGGPQGGAQGDAETAEVSLKDPIVLWVIPCKLAHHIQTGELLSHQPVPHDGVDIVPAVTEPGVGKAHAKGRVVSGEIRLSPMKNVTHALDGVVDEVVKTLAHDLLEIVVVEGYRIIEQI